MLIELVVGFVSAKKSILTAELIENQPIHIIYNVNTFNNSVLRRCGHFCLVLNLQEQVQDKRKTFNLGA